MKYFVQDGKDTMTLVQYCAKHRVNIKMIHKRIYARGLHKTGDNSIWLNTNKHFDILYPSTLKDCSRVTRERKETL